jgi:hypothetical protein
MIIKPPTKPRPETETSLPAPAELKEPRNPHATTANHTSSKSRRGRVDRSSHPGGGPGPSTCRSHDCRGSCDGVDGPDRRGCLGRSSQPEPIPEPGSRRSHGYRSSCDRAEERGRRSGLGRAPEPGRSPGPSSRRSHGYGGSSHRVSGRGRRGGQSPSSEPRRTPDPISLRSHGYQGSFDSTEGHGREGGKEPKPPWSRVHPAPPTEIPSAGLTSGQRYDVVFAMRPFSPLDAMASAWPSRGLSQSAEKAS